MARLHESAVRVLIKDVVTGQYEVGEWLPREVDIAETFGISRGVARECIRALEERSLVLVRHGRGAQVLDPRKWDVLDELVASEILAGPTSTGLLSEFLECRRGLEIEAVGLAAMRAGEEDRARLHAAFAQMSNESASEEEYLRADVAFHEALVVASGNRAMAQTLLRMHQALLCARTPLARPQRRREVGLPEHERILLAVCAGDQREAKNAMADHLDTVFAYLNEPLALRD